MNKWRLATDYKQTLQAVETSLLIKLYKKRSMGMLISLGEPIDTTKPYKRGILSQHTRKSTKMLVSNP